MYIVALLIWLGTMILPISQINPMKLLTLIALTILTVTAKADLTPAQLSRAESEGQQIADAANLALNQGNALIPAKVVTLVAQIIADAESDMHVEGGAPRVTS
jgi:hypothetical protein